MMFHKVTVCPKTGLLFSKYAEVCTFPSQVHSKSMHIGMRMQCIWRLVSAVILGGHEDSRRADRMSLCWFGNEVHASDFISSAHVDQNHHHKQTSAIMNRQ